MTSELPSHWGPIRRDHAVLTPRQRRMLGRRSWFVRMAALGFVPASSAKTNKAALIAAALPDLFPSPQAVAPFITHERWDLLEPNGFTKKVEMRVRLPGTRVPIPALVNAKTATAAADLLRSALPEGTEIA
jgi:hypothetical protein